MNFKKPIIITALLLFAIYSGSCQNKIISPKIGAKFDSIYSTIALNVVWENTSMNSASQQVSFDCASCKEGLHQTITFDINGSILNRDVLISEQDLPTGATTYIENNYPNGFKYGHINKSIGNSGQATYKVDLLQTDPDGTPTHGGWVYVLTFNDKGEYISMEKRMSNL